MRINSLQKLAFKKENLTCSQKVVYLFVVLKLSILEQILALLYITKSHTKKVLFFLWSGGGGAGRTEAICSQVWNSNFICKTTRKINRRTL